MISSPEQICFVAVALNAGVQVCEGRHARADEIRGDAAEPAVAADDLVLDRVST